MDICVGDDPNTGRNKVRKNSQGDYLIQYQEGHTYTGALSSGIMNGFGKYNWCDGLSYEGTFSDCILTGTGKYAWADGSIYVGEVVNGLRHGKGNFYCTNTKTVYIGEWFLGKRHGNGKLLYNSSQTCFYDGQWVDNMKQGHGVEKYKSGDVYDGEWYHNSRHGKGLMQWHSKNEMYIGNWKFGLQHGHGKHIWIVDSNDDSQYPLTNQFIGEWKNGARYGNGVFSYASGAVFEGMWKNNKKASFGEYTLKDCGKFQCFFQDDSIEISEAIVPLENDHCKITDEEIRYVVINLLPAGDIDSVQSIIIRYISQLKQIYNFYSSFCNTLESGEKSILQRLQFSAFLRDINTSQYGLSIYDAENCGNISTSDPEDKITLKYFLQVLILISIKIYNHSEPFPKFLTNFLAKVITNSGGIIPSKQISENLRFQRRIWNIYKLMKKEKLSVKYRDIFFIFKDSKIIDQFFTSQELVNIMSDGLADFNTDVKISFLEFYELMSRCGSNMSAIPLKNKKGSVNLRDTQYKLCDQLLSMVETLNQ